jgi:uncharacterized protein YcbK (DUF882 family)
MGIAVLVVCAAAHADITHIVQRGHTIEAIAHRYHVSVRAIVEANHLVDPGHLKPGQTLIIRGVDAPKKKRAQPEKRSGDAHPTTGRAVLAALEPSPEPRGHDGASMAQPEHGSPLAESTTIHATRRGEDFHIRVKDVHGHVPPNALKAFERMMRQGDAMHPVDPRLVALVGIVSNHFGGKTMDIVSGYRAYAPTQYTPHSNHNYGKAVDFRILGVTNESLRDFCRTLRSAGCGYYPNGAFVHLDVRDTKAYWVDWSRPGEPPKYDKASIEADEGTSDVPDERSGEPSQSSPEGSRETQPSSLVGRSAN